MPDDNERTSLLNESPSLERASYGSENWCERPKTDLENTSSEDVNHLGNPSQSGAPPIGVRIKKALWTTPYFLGLFWFSVLFAVPNTFFPAVASAKGLKPWEYGVASSVRKGAGLLAPALTQIMISYLGLKWVAVIFQATFGIQGVLLGASCLFADKNIFLGISTVELAILEFSFVALHICISVIMAGTLKENGNLFLAAAGGLGEMGMMIGSVAAGALADVTSYSVPYYVFGGILLACTLLIATSGHEETERDTQESIDDGRHESAPENATRKSLWGLLLNPFFLADMVGRALCWQVISFNDPTLEPYLAQLQESNGSIGAVFTINSFASLVGYAATCFPYSRKHENLWIFVAVTLMAISYLLIGPAPFIPVEPTFALICTAQALRGLGFAPLFVCTYSHAMRVAVEEAEHPDDVKTRSFVSANLQFLPNVIAIPIAPLAGLLASTFGYRKASMCMFGILAAWAVIAGLIWLGRGPRCHRMKRNPCASHDERSEAGREADRIDSTMDSQRLLV